VKTPKSFVAALAETRLPSVFNPYSDVCPIHDRIDAAKLRRRNLERFLDAALDVRVDTMWIARDLGYRGGRRTGVPLTSPMRFISIMLVRSSAEFRSIGQPKGRLSLNGRQRWYGAF
jgi:hypothetical protein